jgi:hypothetical protein
MQSYLLRIAIVAVAFTVVAAPAAGQRRGPVTSGQRLSHESLAPFA